MRLLRAIIIVAVLVLIWQLVVWLAATPHYILPDPARVAVPSLD